MHTYTYIQTGHLEASVLSEVNYRTDLCTATHPNDSMASADGSVVRDKNITICIIQQYSYLYALVTVKVP